MARSRPLGGRGLTDRQRVFVAEYLIDLNATRAAKRAGYSARSARCSGSRNISKPAIAAAIAEEQAKRLKAIDMTAEEVLRELAVIARANVFDYMRFDKEGELVVDFVGLDRGRAAALSAVTVEDVFTGRGEEKRKVRRVKFRTHGKLGALDRLAKHHGLLRERISHENPDGSALAPQYDARQVARAVLALLREGAASGGEDGAADG